MIPLLTHSRLKSARECARLHQVKYLLGYRPNEDAAELAFGTLIHKGLEAWWNAVKDGVEPSLWLGLAVKAVRGVDGLDAFDLVRAEILLAGYDTRWSEDAADFEVLGVEEQFEFPLINPETGGRSTVWRVAGKLDVRVRRRSDGTYGFIEHKTSSEDISPGSTYFARLRMDGQVSIYFDGAASLGHAPEWCQYDVIGKPGQRPSQVPLTDDLGQKIVLNAQGERVRTAAGKWRQTGDTEQGYALQTRPETPAEYQTRIAEVVSESPHKFFRRGVVVRLEGELAESRAEVWQQAAILRENANANRHPRNPDACTRGQRVCPFFAVCCGEASLEDARLFTRLENPHPELAGHPTSNVERGDVNANSEAATTNATT